MSEFNPRQKRIWRIWRRYTIRQTPRVLFAVIALSPLWVSQLVLFIFEVIGDGARFIRLWLDRVCHPLATRALGGDMTTKRRRVDRMIREARFKG
jgi:hypothetical protein